jgi:hypothetical protein
LAEKLDLSRLTPEQIRQLEEVLSNLISGARASAERPRAITAETDHSSHASG